MSSPITNFQHDRYYALPEEQRQALFRQYGSNDAAIRAMDEYVRTNAPGTGTTITTEFAGLGVPQSLKQLGSEFNRENDRWEQAYTFRFGEGQEAAKAFTSYFLGKGFQADGVAKFLTRNNSQALPATDAEIDISEIVHRPWSKNNELTAESTEVLILSTLGYKVVKGSDTIIEPGGQPSSPAPATPPPANVTRTSLTPTGTGDDSTYLFDGSVPAAEINDPKGADTLEVASSVLSKQQFNDKEFSFEVSGTNDFLITFGTDPTAPSLLIKNAVDTSNSPSNQGVGFVEKVKVDGVEMTNAQFLDATYKLP